jgi:hypothetical protein
MPPCSQYEKRDLYYFITPDTSRYREYIRSKQKCDILGPSSTNWERFNTKEDYLNNKEAKTIAVLAEVAAKLARL